MKVSAVRGGGVGGMVVTIRLDSDALDAGAVATLRGLVDACSFADRPPTRRADGVRVELTVEDGSLVSRARFDEHDPPDGAGPLLRWLLDQPNARRSVGR